MEFNVQEYLDNLRSDAELCSTFAAALFRTGHRAKARTWLDKAEALWLEWVNVKGNCQKLMEVR